MNAWGNKASEHSRKRFTKPVRHCLALAGFSLIFLSGCSFSRNFPPPEGPVGSRFVPSVAATDPKPVHSVLVISGGGAKGAFTAGVLNQWTRAGDRPKFTVVTGVSTGSLAAPFAFLGPEYDENLARVYTAIDRSNVYRLRLIAGVFGGDAFASSDPLREQIEKEMPPHLIARIAEEHRAGRRLYVSTTDMDSKQQIVWDLGAIATCGDAQSVALFHDVILASCSIPGAFPPVSIDVNIDGQWRSEMHADGGIATNLLLPPKVLGIEALGTLSPTPHRGTDVYVIVNGQLEQKRKPVKSRVVSILTEGIAGAASLRDSFDLMEIYMMCQNASASFRYVSIPNALPEGSFSNSFTRANRQKVYAIGESVGRAGKWHRVPPALLPNNTMPPRADIFVKTALADDRY
jgi:hypothetical protein